MPENQIEVRSAAPLRALLHVPFNTAHTRPDLADAQRALHVWPSRHRTTGGERCKNTVSQAGTQEEREPGPWPHASDSGLRPGGPSARALRLLPVSSGKSPMDESQSPSSADGGDRRSEHGEQVPPPTTLLPQGGAEPLREGGAVTTWELESALTHTRPPLLVSFSSGRYLELLRFSQVQRQENKSNVQL